MRNSNEKYGETTGAKAETYSVAGFLLERVIGRQKVPLESETEPVSKHLVIGVWLLVFVAFAEIGCAETR